MVNNAAFVLCRNFNGFDEIAGEFTSKVDFRKSSKILSMLSMLQKASKRRSPNLLIISQTWQISVRDLKVDQNAVMFGS